MNCRAGRFRLKDMSRRAERFQLKDMSRRAGRFRLKGIGNRIGNSRLRELWVGCWNREFARKILFFVLSILCFMAGAIFIRQAADWQKNITLICTETELTDAQIEKMRAIEYEREEGISFTAWKEQRGQQVYDKDKVRSCQVNVLEINGSSELLFPGGRILHREDVEGCMLSEQAAEQLFGSHAVKGLTLRYKERLLVVRDVLNVPEELLIVEGDAKTSSYDRITLMPSWEMTNHRVAEDFAGRHGLSTEHLRYDIFEQEYLLELIPSKWSDFAGFKKSFTDVRADIKLLLHAKKSTIELIHIEKRSKALTGYALGVILGMIVIFEERIRR